MIGNIPNEWKIEKLGNVIHRAHQGVNTAADKVEFDFEGYPIIQTRNITSGILNFDNIKYVKQNDWDLYKKKYQPKINDILLSNIGTIGKSVLVKKNEDFLIHWNIFLIEPMINLILPAFLKKYFDKLDNDNYYERFLKGGTVKFISKGFLSDLLIPIPPLPQQEKIVKVLDISSQLIAKQKELIESYDLFLKSKFIEMFGDIKNNPYGFDVESLSKFGKIITGNTPPRKELENYDDDFIEWIKTDNISSTKLYVSTAKEYLSELGMSKGRTLEKGGLLIACIAGSIKSIGNISMTDRKVTFNQQINAIQPNKDVNSLYLYWLIKLNKNYIHTFATSSMKKMISKGVFQDIPFIKAPFDLQNEFSLIASKMAVMKDKETQKFEHLETLHNSLMNKAFKGEIV